MAEQAHTRPLSPHLQIYRWPVTMMTSITHRATGLALTAGTVLLAWWLIAIATGPDAYDTVRMVARSPIGLIVIFGFIWSLAFHLLSGIRHLAWDVGYGFETHRAAVMGVVIIVLSVVLAAAVFFIGYEAAL